MYQGIREIELKKQSLIVQGKKLCPICNGSGIGGYSSVCYPEVLECNECKGKGYKE